MPENNDHQNGDIPDTTDDAQNALLKKLFGPVSKELGQLLKERVSFYRLKNFLDVQRKAADLLEQAGVTPSQVPFRTLIPLLEGASLEDDENLKCLWSGLLASAISGHTAIAVHPSFANVLRELTPIEAQLVHEMYGIEGKVDWDSFKKSMIQKYQLDDDTMSFIFLNLFRLMLCGNTSNQGYIITDYGKYFVQACRGPVVDSGT